MASDELTTRLGDLLRERAGEFGVPDDAPDLLVHVLVEECDLSVLEARSLADGESAGLSPAATLSLAETFALSPALLGCILRPVSSEVLHHAIVDVSGNNFDAERCFVCDSLQTRVRDARGDDAHEDLLDLCFDVLEHMVVPPAGEEDELLDEDAYMEPDTMGDVLAQLDPSARLRVFAYAYQELAQTTDGAAASSFAAYARLRSEHLPDLPRRVFDILSQAPEGTLSAAELAEALALEDAGELASVERDTYRALAALSAAGFPMGDTPLIVSDGPPVRLRLTATARSTWRALVHAERAAAAS